MNNFILMTDSYKLSHHGQYPKNTTKIYSYLESRGGLYPKTIFFGLQYYLRKYLSKVIITEDMVKEAKEFAKEHFGIDIFNYDGWMHIAKNLGGILPIKIMAAKEGSLIPVSNVLMTIENTDDRCAWLTNHCETILMKLWAPITIATNSFYCRRTIAKYLERTGGDLSNLPFKLHDFGYRGVSSEESAGILGMSHLTSFMGTDTLAAILYSKKYYDGAMSGFSVPASEHSVACSFGPDKEQKYFLNMLDTYPDSAIVSVVSDTYDVFNFVEIMGKEYKDRIMARSGKVVFRPDSGDPVEVNSRLIDILWNRFGGTYVNGFKLLPAQVGLIQGDGIDAAMIEKILQMAKAKGFSSDNWVFGSGGGLLQKFDRDTQKFAIKASYGERTFINQEDLTAQGGPDIGEPVTKGFNIKKDPITAKDKGSKSGKMILHKSSCYSTMTSNDRGYDSYTNDLDLVFENGEIKREQSFEDIRNLINTH